MTIRQNLAAIFAKLSGAIFTGAVSILSSSGPTDGHILEINPPQSSLTNTDVQITASATTKTPLVLQAKSSQIAHILAVRNKDNEQAVFVSAGGALFVNGSGDTNSQKLIVNVAEEEYENTEAQISASGSNQILLVLEAYPSSTGQALVIKTGTEAPSFQVSAGGNVTAAGFGNFGGGFSAGRQTFSTTGSISATGGSLVGFTGTSGGTLTLPAAATAGAGRIFIIKDEGGNADPNTIIIDGNGAETIDGAANFSMNVDKMAVALYCTGTAWFIFGKYL